MMPPIPGYVWLEVPYLPPRFSHVWIDAQQRIWLAFPTLVYCWLAVAQCAGQPTQLELPLAS